MSTTLKEAKRLHDLGFAILWIREREKRPVSAAWTTGPRQSWDELKRTYRKGYNVGTRLGEASLINGVHYLACIDLDIKDPACKTEALTKLKELTCGQKFPTVASGSGGGSRHLYFVTKTPLKTVTVAKVKDKWEICIYGTGRQMVLPGSIHPNGKPYVWTVSPSACEPPIMDFSHLEAAKDAAQSKEVTEDFKLSSIQLDQTDLPEALKALITDGKDCNDRSGACLKVANAMVRHGLNDNEILTILSEPDTFLGKCAYDHTKSTSRLRAVKWLREYTVDKARKDFDVSKDFAAVVSEEDNTPKLSADAAEKQRSEIIAHDYKLSITRNPETGRPYYTLKNTVAILGGHLGETAFRRCLFSGYYLNGRDMPWKAKRDKEISDADIPQMILWLSKHFSGFEPKEPMLDNAITCIAMENTFHPVREYLDGLEWDGKLRLSSWMKRLLGAHAPAKYLQAVSRKTLIAMVARVYVPGIKFDYVPIWVGKQGARKSTGVEVLASPKWFTDTTIDVANKDGAINMRAKWVIELGELSSMRQADTEHLKAFLSRRVDRYRVPHGSRSEDFERQSVFIGTTNKDKFLKDPTGNRRFWPVDVGDCDIEGLAQERDQLFAEAKFAFELGEELYLNKEEEIEAIEEQISRVLLDSWDEKLSEFFDNPASREPTIEGFDWSMFKLNDLFSKGGPLADMRDEPHYQSRAVNSLKRLGYKSKPGKKPGAENKTGNYWKKWGEA